ncbi:ferrochelatase [Formivibrio citricus]|uniref:Ferrochelatase n=1 Tax=Formivibrio citricus TaxID=83765 RepID=A0A1I4Y5R9_9NEIS|nr:ferrochelatase [Formivibrio citricus]SFN33422.1 ferrochelatase [Formivibrio citricus]
MDTCPPRIGILLVNLGTPQAPTPQAVRSYLSEFLSDPRVVELPRALWWLILNGFVLRFRPAKSAAKYAAIWAPEGSPLQIWSTKQAKLLKGWLGEILAEPVRLELAMRYGKPSMAEGVANLVKAGCDRLLLVPLYPQYAASTTASVVDELGRILASMRNQPALRTIHDFHDDPGYIAALAQTVREQWSLHGRGDHLLMSFHGAPQVTHERGDPYYRQCLATGKLLAAELGLATGQYTIAFQSRFGPAKWLQPYTDKTLQALGQQKTGKLYVICPGFVADCLETLEEIAMEGKKTFLAAGGHEFRYIPCLNDHPRLIEFLGKHVSRELTGWLTAQTPE